jgi:5'-nucleotidase
VGEPGTDLHAVAAGYVSITPVQLDLTDHALIDQIANWRLGA